uniref:Prolyl 4-hydroxylase alpha-subunit N-terminal domain-containing protein n=1 Tax=Clastoptera arizonana TaxID=38151 RepID=A0A1B6DVF5_9HEMI
MERPWLLICVTVIGVVAVFGTTRTPEINPYGPYRKEIGEITINVFNMTKRMLQDYEEMRHNPNYKLRDYRPVAEHATLRLADILKQVEAKEVKKTDKRYEALKNATDAMMGSHDIGSLPIETAEKRVCDLIMVIDYLRFAIV